MTCARLLCAVVLAGACGTAIAVEGTVTRVSDGDTLWIRPHPAGRYVKLRLHGMDAPELCQPWGQQSRRALEALALGKVVRVEGRLRDDHGRRLVRVLLGGEDLGARMVRDGNAWSYRWRDDPGPYASDERAARAARRGLFAAPDAIAPREFRRLHGPCS